jgi:hypothetical protein
MLKCERKQWLIVWLLSTSACVSAHVPQPAQRPDTGPGKQVPVQPATPGNSQWTIRYSERGISYRITRKATIQSSDSMRTRESSTNMTHETVTLTSLASDSTMFRVLVTADSFVTTSQGRIGTSAAPKLPIEVEAMLSDSGLTIPLTAGDTTCNPTASIIAADLSGLLPKLPSTLSSGLRWQDSTQTHGCQGGVATNSRSVRSFNAVGEVTYGGQSAIQIEATDSITAEGQGIQLQHQIALTANGTGHATYFIDTATGRVVHLQRIQTLNISITAEGRDSQFVQTLEQKFDAVP